MNLQVKHNNVDITQYVISWNREHKICTGVGQLSVVISQTVGRTFNPWDSISIYENGTFQVKYYISTINHNVPSATYELDCQDNSKRLVDYFIPDSYTIDYPSLTKYWIEKFLTEAGISYTFLTSSPGTLLSNYTQLGLNSAYEQIKILLQQSGWYMFFDGNGVCKIGTLDTDLSSLSATLNRDDILTISKQSHDKMLRNRAVVLGAFDPLYNEMSVADLTIHTPWNYGHDDLRTVVISNSNIPNSATAFGMAQQILSEFSRITVEKHITSPGARGLDLGDYIHVNSNVYTGNGLITTYGTTLDAQGGLTTNMILDERCPRLFGYFDFGDSVYVGTYGDGVWRKHIKFDNQFYDFSTGLEDDMAITDLHINNGLFTSVAASGGMNYTINELPWKPIVLEYLESSLESNLNAETSSGIYIPHTFSGIMARATIIDRDNNRLLYGVDTYSGPNLGDYWMTLSGYSTTQSGFMTEESITVSGWRGWIVDYGTANVSEPPTSYPIHVSGNYDIRVVDIENDGVNDFVSVAEYGMPSIDTDGNNWSYGKQTALPYAFHSEPTAIVAAPKDLAFVANNGGAYSLDFMSTASRDLLIASDEGNIGERWAVTLGKDGKARESRFENSYNEMSGEWQVNYSTVTSALAITLTGGSISDVVAIYPLDSYRTYRFISYHRLTSPFNGLRIYYQDWDSYTDTWGARTILHDHAAYGGATSPSGSGINTMTLGGYFYIGWRYGIKGSYNPFFGWDSPGRLIYEVIKIDMKSLAASTLLLVNFEMPDDGSGHYYHLQPVAGLNSWEGVVSAGTIDFYQKGSDVGVLGRFHAPLYLPVGGGEVNTKEYVVHGTTSGVEITEVYSGVNRVGGSFPAGELVKLTNNKALVHGDNGSYFIYSDESTIYLHTPAGVPATLVEANVRPIISTSSDDYYIALDGANWLLVNSSDPFSYSTIVPPSGYSLNGVFPRAIDFYQSKIYWRCRNTSTLDYEIIPYTVGDGFSVEESLVPDYLPGSTTRGTNFGGFFINEPSTYSISNPQALVYYLNFGEPELLGAIRFHVLLRQESDFTILQTDSYPIRMDVSNRSPLLTATSGSDSFTSNFLYDGFLTQVNPFNIEGLFSEPINDFRYTLLDTYSGFTIFAATPSGFYTADTLTMSGVLNSYVISSGSPNMVETTNFAADGQYLFVTTSGDNPLFYQRDPGGFQFDLYDSLPESRATVIRIDDRM